MRKNIFRMSSWKVFLQLSLKRMGKIKAFVPFRVNLLTFLFQTESLKKCTRFGALWLSQSASLCMKKELWNKINQENKSRGAELLFNIKADMSDPDFYIICTKFESSIATAVKRLLLLCPCSNVVLTNYMRAILKASFWS